MLIFIFGQLKYMLFEDHLRIISFETVKSKIRWIVDSCYRLYHSANIYNGGSFCIVQAVALKFQLNIDRSSSTGPNIFANNIFLLIFNVLKYFS